MPAWRFTSSAHPALLRLVLGYLIIVPAQLSVSYSNDYFDVEVDRHSVPSLFSGGSGILVSHPGLRKPAMWVAIGLMGCSMALGILFAVIYAYPIWFLGYVALSNLVGWFYTAPPLRMAYRGLGELSNALTGGLLIPVMGFLVASGTLNSAGLLFTLPLVLYGLAFILSAEIPDMEADRLGHKHTWVARWGRGFSFTAIAFLLLAAAGFFFSVPYLSSQAPPLNFNFLGLLSLLPLAAGVLGLIKRPLERQAAARLANANIIALAVFLILMDGTMVLAAAH